MKRETTTTKMRAEAHKLIYSCKEFDEWCNELCKARNTRDYEHAQEMLYDKALETKKSMLEMVSQLNLILCAADAIDIHKYYHLELDDIREHL